MKGCKRILLLVIGLMSLALAFGCGKEPIDRDYTVKVLLRETEGIIIEGDSLVEVEAGKMVTFKVSLKEGYVYVSNTAGAEYDAKGGRLRLKNVIAPTTVDMIVVPEWEAIHFDVKSNVTDAKVSASAYLLGTEGNITVNTEDAGGYRFAGWSKGGFIEDGGEFISANEEYTLFVSEDTVLYANFETLPYYEIVYLLNGGVDSETGEESYTYLNPYKETFAMQQTLYHNGRFVREGYSAVGYSTEAVSYEDYASANDIPDFANMGGVTFVKDSHKELYVVWAKETAQRDFTYSEKNIKYVTDSRYEWGQLKKKEETEKGIEITGYVGSGKLVVIPESINGLPVLSIASGAVSGDVERVVIPKSVKNIEDGAFSGCQALREVVFFDSVVKVSDKSFPNTIETIVLNSQRLPVYSGAIEGSFAIKYERLRAVANQKKIVVISGSSSLNGLDSPRLEELMPGYSVVNYGTNVANSMVFFIDVAAKYAHEGDIIVYAPEFADTRAMGTAKFHAKMFRGNEQCYDIFRDVNMTEYQDFWDSFCEFQIGDSGDSSLVPAIHQSGKEYQLETELNRYGDRTTTRWGVTGNFGAADDVFKYDILDADNLNFINRRVTEKGATLVMSFATHDITVTAPSAAKQSECDRFTKDCADKLDFPVISNVHDYIWEHKYFFDSEWHPNDEGATMRSELLARDIKAYLVSPDNY